jgi:hypothetical protein
MVYLYEACDQKSDFCHQQILRKMWRKISWTDGRTEGRTDEQRLNSIPPPPSGSGGIITNISVCLGILTVELLRKCLSDNTRVRILIFFHNLALGYMTKTLNHNIFFFLHQNQNIFFSNIVNQNIFLETPPLFQVKWSFPMKTQVQAWPWIFRKNIINVYSSYFGVFLLLSDECRSIRKKSISKLL